MEITNNCEDTEDVRLEEEPQGTTMSTNGDRKKKCRRKKKKKPIGRGRRR